MVKLEEAKNGFVLLPRRWVVERSFAWATRFRRLAKDYERLPETVAGLHFLVFACLMLARIAKFFAREYRTRSSLAVGLKVRQLMPCISVPVSILAIYAATFLFRTYFCRCAKGCVRYTRR